MAGGPNVQLLARRPRDRSAFRVDLAGDRYLRLLEEPDAVEVYALIEANREHLARWLPWAGQQTFEATMAFIRGTRRQLAEDDGFQAGIVRDESLVGVVGFHSVQWGHRATSIGYWLGAAEQGRGTMTLAVAALLDHAFDEWGLNRVEIRAATENHRSRAVAERLGFRLDGILREAERVGDRFFDNAVYSRLAGDRMRSISSRLRSPKK
jgi:ribosomal-protein-serine acetyltransferase